MMFRGYDMSMSFSGLMKSNLGRLIVVIYDGHFMTKNGRYYDIILLLLITIIIK